ncbi:MAG: transporter substrate-binding domain-containing protein [Oscillospiraceae bacterium]|nr:transporter substrate-binding domain-containing protein [Oscillospiraceae bacterium]
MKRIFALLISVILLASAAACSEGSTDGGSGAGDGSNIGAGSGGIKSPADFAGKKIAVQDETTADESIALMIDDGMDIDVFRYPQVINCFDDLKIGRVDAVYVDSVVAAFYTTGSTEYQRVWLSDEAEPLGICLDKNSENLLAAIEAAVDTLYYNGEMANISRKHFGEDLTAGLRNVTSEPVIPPVSDDDLRTPGVFSVGADIGYPPMEYYDRDGTTPIGFDIDVGKAIADLLGLEHKVIDTAWDGIFDSVERGDFDCIMSSVSITVPRQQRHLLTQPYVANALCIVVKN